MKPCPWARKRSEPISTDSQRVRQRRTGVVAGGGGFAHGTTAARKKSRRLRGNAKNRVSIFVALGRYYFGFCNWLKLERFVLFCRVDAFGRLGTANLCSSTINHLHRSVCLPGVFQRFDGNGSKLSMCNGTCIFGVCFCFINNMNV